MSAARPPRARSENSSAVSLHRPLFACKPAQTMATLTDLIDTVCLPPNGALIGFEYKQDHRVHSRLHLCNAGARDSKKGGTSPRTGLNCPYTTDSNDNRTQRKAHCVRWLALAIHGVPNMKTGPHSCTSTFAFSAASLVGVGSMMRTTAPQPGKFPPVQTPGDLARCAKKAVAG